MPKTLSQMVPDVYELLGNISTQQLPLRTVLQNFNNVLSRRLKQLGLSTQNRLIQSTTISLSTSTVEYPVSLDDFGIPILCEFNTLQNSTFYPIDIVNFVSLGQAALENRQVVAFYGDPNQGQKVKFSYIGTGNFTPSQLRIWYEPDTPVSKDINSTPAIAQMFVPFVTMEVAQSVLPHVDDMDLQTKQGLALVFGQALAEWAELWRDEIFSSKNRKRVSRAPFRAGW